MQLISKAELSKRSGVSRAAVTQAIKRGTIPETADGHVDADDPTIRAYIARATSTKKIKPHPQENKPKPRRSVLKPKAKLDPVPRPSPTPVDTPQPLPPTINTPPPEPPPGYTSDSDLSQYDRHDLDRIKILEQIKKLRIESSIKEQTVVKREVVQSLLAAVWGIDTSEWVQLGNKLAPDIVATVRSHAADRDAEIAVNEVISDSVYATLKHLKSKLRDWIVAEIPKQESADE